MGEVIFNTIQILAVIPVLGLLLGYIEKILGVFFSKVFGNTVALFIMNHLTLIGVMHHELSHALFAFVSGATIKSIDLFKPQNNTLGSVEIIPKGNKIAKSIQLTLTAIAPVVTGIISMCSILYFVNINFNSMAAWHLVTVAYLFLSILIHSTMSTADLKCAMKGLPICTLIVFIFELITKFSLIDFLGGILK